MKRLLPLALAIALSSCSTIDRLDDFPEPPQIYGGIRNYHTFWHDEIGMPSHGCNGPFGFLFAADAVGALLLDTLLLPLTIYAEATYEGEEEEEEQGSYE